MVDRAVTILVVDDHSIVRGGIRAVTDGFEGMSVVGEAGSVAETLAFLRAHAPDVVLLDLGLPDGDGIELIGRIRSEFPQTCVVVLTAYGTDRNVRRARSAGAAGFLVKSADGASIRRGIENALNGLFPSPDTYTHPSAVAGAADNDSVLSPREREVLTLIASGFQNKEISAELDLAEKSVRNIVTRLFRKLGVGNRTEAALWLKSGNRTS